MGARVLGRRGQADQGHARVLPNRLGERDERRRADSAADTARRADEDVRVNRARRDLVQPQAVERGPVHALPPQVADLILAAGDDGLRGARRRARGPGQIPVGIGIPARDVGQPEPDREERQMRGSKRRQGDPRVDAVA
jgi:hypothetical protein